MLTVVSIAGASGDAGSPGGISKTDNTDHNRDEPTSQTAYVTEVNSPIADPNAPSLTCASVAVIAATPDVAAR